jgi:hypothetical protein
VVGDLESELTKKFIGFCRYLACGPDEAGHIYVAKQEAKLDQKIDEDASIFDNE